MLLGGRIRPEHLGKKCIYKNKRGQETGDPAYLPSQHDQKTGGQSKGAASTAPAETGALANMPAPTSKRSRPRPTKMPGIKTRAYEDPFPMHVSRPSLMSLGRRLPNYHYPLGLTPRFSQALLREAKKTGKTKGELRTEISQHPPRSPRPTSKCGTPHSPR